MIVGPDGLRAVIDWELAHVGDPMEDLGWLCVKAWRFGATPPVAGLGEYDDLFASYEAAGGVADRPGRRALVGGARHLEVGDHVHPAGERAPHRRQRAATSWRPSGGACARTSTTSWPCWSDRSASAGDMTAPHDAPSADGAARSRSGVDRPRGDPVDRRPVEIPRAGGVERAGDGRAGDRTRPGAAGVPRGPARAARCGERRRIGRRDPPTASSTIAPTNSGRSWPKRPRQARRRQPPLRPSDDSM